MAVFPALELRYDLVSRLCALGCRDVEIAGEAWVVRHHVVEVPGLLEGAHNRSAAALGHPEDASLLAAVATGAAVVAGVTDEAGDHPVSVQRRAQVGCRDEEVLASLLLGEHVSGASSVQLQLAGEEVRSLGDDEVVAPHTHDPA